MSDTQPTKTELSPALKQWLGFALAVILGFLASRYGITPQPAPDPILLPFVVQSAPAGQSCQCQTFAATSIEAKRVNGPIRALVHRLVKQRQADAKAEDIDAAIDALTSDRPFLDWIRSGELLELIKAILEILRVIKPM